DDLLANGKEPRVIEDGAEIDREVADVVAAAEQAKSTKDKSASGDPAILRLSNYFEIEVGEGQKKSKVKVGHQAPYIAEQLFQITRGWPKRVGGRLFVESEEGQPMYLTSTSSFFGWLGGELAKHEATLAQVIAAKNKESGKNKEPELPIENSLDWASGPTMV